MTTTSKDRIALFIGAGFSYELGMPLVWDLTKELGDCLTGDKLRELNRGWIKQGGGVLPKIIEDFVPHLEDKNLHYEKKIEWLEDRYLDYRNPHRNEYHELLVRMTETVGGIINLRHANNIPYIMKGCELYSGFAALADAQRPLWVFSLNHDACVEALCASFDTPLYDGFPNDYVTFPSVDGSVVKFARLSMKQLEHGLVFAGDGECAVNLLKLHGSIDTFRYTDVQDWLKFRPQGSSAEDVLRETSTFEESLRVHPEFGKMNGEIACCDHDGEVQFLRRTLLSGGHKFQGVINHNAPMEVIKIMRQALDQDVGTLILIGYSGGDEHINQELRKWMDGDNDRHLVIVDPHKDTVPSVLDQWPGRVELKKERATDFFCRVGRIPRTPEQEQWRKARAFIRKQKEDGKGDIVKADFMAFMQEEYLKAGVEFATSFPPEAPVPTTEEARNMVLEHFASLGLNPVELLSRFVNDRADEDT